mmetsp:Transcript_15466/g.27698  ORF Transcript_15466/g.27698 Transcript_15466/m.27698 type:complete len:289 (-) Transcript_15466:65-931(-)
MVTNTTFCKVWATTDEVSPLPSGPFLTAYMIVLAISGFVVICIIRSLRPKDMRRILTDAGVAIDKVKKTAQEIERKSFHIAGLLVPLIYQVLLQYGFSHKFCTRILWTITISGCTSDMLRIHVPFVARNWPMKSILREQEHTQLCGGSYFSLGCTLVIHGFTPVIAMTSIIFLVLGDMSAALIGRSFGRTLCTIGVGPGGKKSVEGSGAMFLVCFVFGCTIFSQVHLREYPVFVASLVATLTELYEPLGINDNLTIPIFTSIALTLGFARIYSCAPDQNPLLWNAKHS